jgi:hypothetical protein
VVNESVGFKYSGLKGGSDGNPIWAGLLFSMGIDFTIRPDGNRKPMINAQAKVPKQMPNAHFWLLLEYPFIRVFKAVAKRLCHLITCAAIAPARRSVASLGSSDFFFKKIMFTGFE